MKVIIGCEKSHRIAGEFRKLGHDAWSCDILPCEIDTPYHIQDDILKHLDDGWDLGIFHPDCTRICNSGVRWLNERNLWKEMEEACLFFNKLKESNIPKICLENPIPHKYAVSIIGIYTQLIQPHYFGDKESKATCLWLKNLPELKRTHFIDKSEIKQSVWREAPSEERKVNRARTYIGIAKAMANQWG